MARDGFRHLIRHERTSSSARGPTFHIEADAPPVGARISMVTSGRFQGSRSPRPERHRTGTATMARPEISGRVPGERRGGLLRTSFEGVSRFRVNVFRQRGVGRDRAAPHPPRSRRWRSWTARGRPAAVRGEARARARHRADRLGQDHDARRDDRPHQRAPGASHRDDRGPDRGPPRGQALDHQPARGRLGHRGLPPRACSGRCARTPT